jgi:Secretion system C-terminal sorting domain
MLGSSHPCRYDISGQHTLKFYFDNILLPDSNINEPMSHGYVKYKIKPELYLPINPYLISNRADIYFDFNPAVQTNTVVSTMVVSVGLNELSDVQFKVQPNPVGDKVHLVSSAEIDLQSTTIYDVQGRVVFDNLSNAKDVYVGMLNPGVYNLKIKYQSLSSKQDHYANIMIVKK